MSIELKQLSTEDGEDVYDMLQEIGTNEYGFMNEVKGMSFDEYKLWLKQEDGYSRAENLPENWVPGTTFFLFIDEIPVGIGRIRHYSNENLEQRGVGNFGYGISKPYRNKGYGSILFEKLLMKCKTFGYSKIKLYAYIDNIATNKIMLKNGAKLIGIFNGEKNIYEFSLY